MHVLLYLSGESDNKDINYKCNMFVLVYDIIIFVGHYKMLYLSVNNGFDLNINDINKLLKKKLIKNNSKFKNGIYNVCT